MPGYGPPVGYAPFAPPPVPLAPDGRPLADFGTRLLAYLIDSALITGIMAIIFVPVFFAYLINSMRADLRVEPGAPYDSTYGMSWVTESFWPFVLLELGLFAFLLIAYYVYYVEMMFRSGQTFGKKLMKIKVVPLQPGATMTRGRAAKRYLVEVVVGTVVLLFAYLDGLWQLWDKPYQQTLHDKAAQTVVIKVAP
jgi:uncharacterized RDD family membrane protein YckC